MLDLRIDARRACSARRERGSSTPARVVPAAFAAVLGIGAAATLTALLGFSLYTVLAVCAVVALAGAAAAHQVLGNVLAGLTLLVVRPYAPGERVRLLTDRRATPVEAEIVRVGLANTTLGTSSGLLVVPNLRLLQAPPPVASD